MEPQTIIDPELEEERQRDRKRSFFARVVGIIVGTVGGIWVGVHRIEASLIDRVSRQLYQRDWRFFGRMPLRDATSERNAAHILEVMVRDLPGPEKILFEHEKVVHGPEARPLRVRWAKLLFGEHWAPHDPDPKVQSAFDKLFEQELNLSPEEASKHGVITRAYEKFMQKWQEKVEIRQNRLNGIRGKFVGEVEKIIGRNRSRTTIIQEHADSLTSHIEKIIRAPDSDTRKEALAALRLDVIPLNKAPTIAEELRAVASRMLKDAEKEINNFRTITDKCKREYFDTPIIKEIRSTLGLGIRQAEHKGQTLAFSAVSAVAIGAAVWGGIRLWQFSSDKKEREKSHLERLAARRAALADSPATGQNAI